MHDAIDRGDVIFEQIIDTTIVNQRGDIFCKAG